MCQKKLVPWATAFVFMYRIDLKLKTDHILIYSFSSLLIYLYVNLSNNNQLIGWYVYLQVCLHVNLLIFKSFYLLICWSVDSLILRNVDVFIWLIWLINYIIFKTYSYQLNKFDFILVYKFICLSVECLYVDLLIN